MPPDATQADILLVDDEPANLLALEAVLARPGWNLVRAHSGAEALKQLLARDFAVVLLDVHMPGMDGFEAARLIRSRPRSRHTPIILVTAHDTSAFPIEEGYSLGAVDYLQKPINPSALVAKVAMFVELFRATRRAEEQGERLRLVLDTAHGAFVAMTADGLIADWNRRAEEVFGWRRDEVVGRPLADVLVPPRFREAYAAGLRRYLETGRSNILNRRIEMTALRRDGAEIPIDLSIAPLRTGGAVVFNCFLYDVSDRKRLEEESRVYLAELKRSNAELEKFAYVASHDLQEPLRKIQAFGDRLQVKCGERLGPEGRDYLDRMRAAATRMRTLIDDLLTLSRVATRGREVRRVDLAEIVRDVVSDLEARIQQTGGRVDVGPLPAVEADPVQMRQLFQNLIGNALKFHKPDVPPVVTVDARPADGRWEVRVRDNGIGFNELYLDRIFEVFQRLHGRDEYEGTGIGLAICKKIVERHGGTITAASTPGEGATFTVVLPEHQPAGGHPTTVPEKDGG